MDEKYFDQAQQLAEAERDAGVEAARNAPVLAPRRFCYNCGDRIKRGCFCPGGECRDDYEKRMRKK